MVFRIPVDPRFFFCVQVQTCDVSQDNPARFAGKYRLLRGFATFSPDTLEPEWLGLISGTSHDN